LGFVLFSGASTAAKQSIYPGPVAAFAGAGSVVDKDVVPNSSRAHSAASRDVSVRLIELLGYLGALNLSGGGFVR
jgi:hypothetical protein